MNTRRSFFKTLATDAAGFTILPPALTYERVWRATRAPMTLTDLLVRKLREDLELSITAGIKEVFDKRIALWPEYYSDGPQFQIFNIEPLTTDATTTRSS